MRLDELIERLPEGAVGKTMLSDPKSDVYNVAFLTSSSSDKLRSDVLYFSDSELLPTHV
ncbi:MAG: hypothetical protein IJ781_10160 [Atopobiaceae bacterium]|nr:hypothetical protein [Atopobiaceae bacterium]